MHPDELKSLPLSDLIDLLSKSTGELLQLMHQHAGDTHLTRDKRLEVQMIQEAIDRRKSEE